MRITLTILLLAPLAGLFYRLWYELSPDPIKEIYTLTGLGALWLLLLTLSLAPLQRYTPLKLRSYGRFFGLWSALYATLHLANYLGLDHTGEMREAIEEIAKKPFILLGGASMAILWGLALSSIPALFRRFRRWHTLAHPALWLGACHYFMAQKVATMSTYATLCLVAILALLRLHAFLSARRA